MRSKMPKRTITVKRKPYYRKDGTYVRGSTFKAEDKGKKGITPESKRWFTHQTTMNWSKDMPVRERRQNALIAHGDDPLATARALQALVNVTTSTETKIEARKDALYFFREYRRRK